MKSVEYVGDDSNKVGSIIGKSFNSYVGYWFESDEKTKEKPKPEEPKQPRPKEPDKLAQPIKHSKDIKNANLKTFVNKHNGN